MSTVDIGRRAEQAAADFLRAKGCAIITQNWRTRWCEIDVVAERGGVLYFCEVKYRRSLAQGSGLDYITPKKLQQMGFAAESWVHAHAYKGEYQLCAIEVTGAQFAVTGVVKDLS